MRGTRVVSVMFLLMLAAAATGAAPFNLAPAAKAPISLHGEWSFRLDPNKVGVEEKWFGAALPDTIKLPGSTDEGGFGTKNTRPPDFNYLSRIVEHVGPAWYQRTVVVPGDWEGKRITLSLERCHWETRVWVDDRACGMRDSLCVPHVYDLSESLTPGKHRLTIRVDNSLKYDMGRAAHSTSEQTQSNWNGIAGRIELRATDPVWIEDLQVYPDVDGKSARVRLTVGNSTGKAASGRVTLQAAARDGGPKAEPCDVEFAASGSSVTVETAMPMGRGARLWDEFSPALHDLTASLAATGGNSRCADERTVVFGMRELSVAGGKQLAVNGRTIFLRGTLECCIFPLTGYPPTDVGAWRRIFRIAQSYGLNHMRFHSWCPPEAAFEAADQMGFLLHVEAPCWIGNWGRDPKRDQFVADEAKRILAAYGNHPSFGMLCMGNEPGGDLSVIHRIVKEIKPTDPRHLYLSGAGWGFGPDDDYRVVPIRGLHGPTTDFDFRAADAKHNAPVISHEIGQWTVYPNLDEMKKYTGVLRPRNFELVHDGLAEKHMLDQAADFTRASGHLMVLLYKEEMEVLLRTPGHAGFQLLDLHDFPGQGTALIGTLDPFWDSKGLIAPEAWRRFCGPTVPLLRMNKRAYTSDETFAAQAEIAHFGPAAIEQAAPVWTIKDEHGREVASGQLAPLTLPTGKLTPLGNVEASLAKAAAPTRLTITLALKGTDIANDWEIWVYPAKVNVSAPPDVVVSRAWDEPTRSALAAGKNVLLLAASTESANSLPGSFTPVFWSPIWFVGRGAGTMSILCDPKHPALARFPTDAHTNWQWHDLLQRSRSIVLDDTPAAFRPIVQVIDNFSRNHKLGNLFEARVGKGRLLVCSIDLEKDLDQRLAARQLLHSLLLYMGSDAFKPAQELDGAFLTRLFQAASSSLLKEEPKAIEKAVLRVRAAAKLATLEQASRWTPENDEVLARREGFDYSVRGSIWRDSVGSAWHDSRNLVVTVTCPRGFQGKLYAHFHDWNSLGRVAEIDFQGKRVGTLRNYDGAGAWLAFPVTAGDSATGRLELSARPTQANVMITQIVLMENEAGGRAAPTSGEPAAPPYPDHSRLLVYRDEGGRERPVATPADWAIRRRHILLGMQEVMGPLPDRTNLVALDMQVGESVRDVAFTRLKISFAAEAGDRVPAYLFLPLGLKEGQTVPAILALHPTSPLGKGVVAGFGDKENRAYALELARRGYIVLAPDYPSFGDYKYDFDTDRYESGTMKGIFNHMRCVDLLQSLPGVDGQRIGVIGHSLGGHNAMFVGAFDERLKAIVSSCGWTPFHDYYKGNIAGWTSPRYMPRLRDVYGLDPGRVPFDFYEVIAALAPRAFFSNSPLRDDNFDVNGVKKGIAAAQAIYTFLGAGGRLQMRYPDCTHDFPLEMRREAYEFLDKALGHTPTQRMP